MKFHNCPLDLKFEGNCIRCEVRRLQKLVKEQAEVLLEIRVVMSPQDETEKEIFNKVEKCLEQTPEEEI